MLPKGFLSGQTRTIFLLRRSLQTSAAARSSEDMWWGPEKCNGREVVGHGEDGDMAYADRVDFWYPAIRFRKDDDIILPIKEKEQGDWKNLTPEEKKLLYRYSFRQTLAEFEAPAGYWKPVVAGCLLLTTMSFLYMTFLKIYVYPPLPPTFDPEYREALAEMELVLGYNPVLGKGQPMGTSKYYNYKKNEWKQ